MNFKIISLLVFAFFALNTSMAQMSPKKYARVYRKTERKIKKELQKHPFWDSKVVQEATPLEWWVQQYMATINPYLQRPTPEKIVEYLQNTPNAGSNVQVMPGTTVNPWVERGPNNVGGRTRAIAWDPIVSNKVWAGAVTGGLWYNTNITSASSSWVHVSGLWSNLNITCIAFDPNNAGIMYVGTGEGFGSSASSSVGAGIWKTADTGKTWSQLSSTTNFLIINDIVVRNESGTSVVYAAVDANYVHGSWKGIGNFGIKRSVNGGTSWTTVGIPIEGKNTVANNIEIGPDNRLWVGTRRQPYSATDRGGSNIMYSDNGTTWTMSYSVSSRTMGRVSVAVAPSDKNYVYALFEDGNKLDSVKRSTDGGATWITVNEPSDADNGIPNTDFTRGQAWYDLVITVDPNNKNTIIAGGVDLFRSTDGGVNWTQISKWSNNNNLSGLSCPLVHADQHAILFKSGSSSEAIIGNDGGVWYSNNFANAASSNTAIVERVKDYNTFQCYWGDIAETAGSNNMIAGAQDNGTEKFTSAGLNSTQTVGSGDGGYCFIDASNSNKQVNSYVYNQYYYTTNNWSSSSPLINDGSTGSFINCAEWDDNKHGLISNKNNGALYRITLSNTTPGTLETISYGGSSKATALSAVKLSNGKTRLWVGDNLGKIWLCNDFWVTTPSFTAKSGTINAGTITSINNPNGSDTVIVTISNFGLNNIYLSTDGGSSYIAKDANLDDLPVWASVINPNKPDEVLIGTEVGVFGTTNFFSSTNPTWSEYTAGMGNVKIATLRLRKSDLTVMASTHGRGVFTSDAFKTVAPVVEFTANKTNPCANETVTITDNTMNDPTTWAWVFTPNTGVVFQNGTSASSKNPQVKLAAGSYTVKLTATNGGGSGNKQKTNYLVVTDTFTPKLTVTAPSQTFCAGSSVTLTPNYSNITATEINNTYSSINGSITKFTGTSASVSAVKNANYKLIATTNKACATKDSFESNVITLNVEDASNINVSIDNKPLEACIGTNLDLTATASGVASSAIKWYVNGVNKATGASYNGNSFNNNDEVVVEITKTGTCVLPTNTVYDTAKVTVNPKPVTPVIQLSWDTLYAKNNGTNTVKWFLNGTYLKDGAAIKLLSNGRYNAVYFDGKCYSDSSNVIVFNSLSSGVVNKYGVEIYPNPAEKLINIHSPVEVTTVELFAANGKRIKHFVVNNKQTEIELPEVAKGIYIMKVQLINGNVLVTNLTINRK